MNFFKREQNFLVACLGGVLLWWILYYFIVTPKWEERDSEVTAAEEYLQKVEGLTKPKANTWAKPKAEAELAQTTATLNRTLTELKRIEMGDLGEYRVPAEGDPNTYFARKRREVLAAIQATAVRLGPGLSDDLGYRDLVATEVDPVQNRAKIALNLARLLALSRFFEAAGAANVRDVLAIQFPAPAALTRPEPPPAPPPENPVPEAPTRHRLRSAPAEEPTKAAGPVLERLIQVPLVIRLRATERDFAQFLGELQPPPAKDAGKARYFCLRGLQVTVKDSKSGVLEASVAVGAIFTEAQLKAQGITLKEDEKSGFGRAGFADPNRY